MKTTTIDTDFKLEAQAILQDRRLLMIWDCTEMLHRAIKCFYKHINPIALYELAPLDNRRAISSQYADLGLAISAHDQAVVQVDPAQMLFHQYLLLRLLPTQPSLANSPEYWRSVLSVFTRPAFRQPLRKQERKRRRNHCRQLQLVHPAGSLEQLDGYFQWLHDFHARTGLPYSAQTELLFYKRYFYPVQNHRMNRVFIEMFVRAANEAGAIPATFSRYHHLLDLTEQLVFANQKANPLTLRNMAHAIVEFHEFAYPALVSRFGDMEADEIFSGKPIVKALFFHWFWRRKRNMSLEIGLDKELPDALRWVPSLNLVRYLPLYLLHALPYQLMEAEQGLLEQVRHFGEGKSARLLPGLPEGFTARAAHWLPYAPKGATPESGVHFGLAMAVTNDLGVATEIMEIVQRHHVCQYLPAAKFMELCRFLHAHQADFSSYEWHPLMDYFQAAVGENPAFSLAGRNARSVRRHMEEWHRTLAYRRMNCEMPMEWEGVKLENLVLEQDGEQYEFRQLTAAEELVREGQVMHHCVASYAYGSANGTHSIWSLRLPSKSGRRLLTLQVLTTGHLVQARGFANRMPDQKEQQLLKAFCRRQNLVLKC